MAELLLLFVRVNLKTQTEAFYRCGMRFDRQWQKVEVDEATAKRLQEEQMLEVEDTQPADYAEPGTPAESAGDAPVEPVVLAGDAPAEPVVPTDPVARAAAIKAAIAALDRADATLWTAGGAPTVTAIVAITGWQITAVERDAAWAACNEVA